MDIAFVAAFVNTLDLGEGFSWGKGMENLLAEPCLGTPAPGHTHRPL